MLGWGRLYLSQSDTPSRAQLRLTSLLVLSFVLLPTGTMRTFTRVLPAAHAAPGCTRRSLTFAGREVSHPWCLTPCPKPWAGCCQHGQSPGQETVTRPRASGQQEADVGFEPRH